MKNIWYVINIALVALALLGGYRSLSPEKLRKYESGCDSLWLNSFAHAVVRHRQRWLLDSALESQQACSPLIEQKPSELVARPFTVVVYFYVHHGIHGNRQCAPASHNWFGWVLDARGVRLPRSRTLDRSDSCLPDISPKHHCGLAEASTQVTGNPTNRALTTKDDRFVVDANVERESRERKILRWSPSYRFARLFLGKASQRNHF
jgi:hypothetical protein